MSAQNISCLLYQAEQQLLQRQLSDFETLLADDFIEYGTSGQIYHKQLLMDSLTNQNQKGDAGIVISQFHCVQLSTDLVQATYQTKEPLNKNRVANRSSLWRRYQGQWQMCFHQGTLVSQDQE
ncbi:DUF4440 domain-containing protein [Amphibacillus sp. Q70]|uniref:nuclear transport factor 2 family protein n=1 Tax=Amphibacillus sp. Q70 TaxID=3453416 RepID=UPI003F840A09